MNVEFITHLHPRMERVGAKGDGMTEHEKTYTFSEFHSKYLPNLPHSWVKNKRTCGWYCENCRVEYGKQKSAYCLDELQACKETEDV